MNIRMLRNFVLGFTYLLIFITTFSAGMARAEDWNVAVLDKILNAASPDQTTVQVGDMFIDAGKLRQWRNVLVGVNTQSAFQGVETLWTGGIVYYTFSNNVTAAHMRATTDAMKEWSLFANVSFVPRTTQANYTVIGLDPSLNGGLSTVGMVGGPQFVHIGNNAWNRGTLVHELGHTLGLTHEHQRSDRDSYITVLTQNIASGEAGNFVKLGDSQNLGAYDFYSIMHYSHNAFSVSNSLDTMQPLAQYSQYYLVMGVKWDPVLSALDRAGMITKYGAASVPLSSVITNTLDNGPGSLRAAFYYAFDHPGSTLTFNIPASDPGLSNGVFNILPTDTLGSVPSGTTLDGSTEPTKNNPNGPAIMLNGALAPAPEYYIEGLRLNNSNAVVRSLIINNFSDAGVQITGTNAVGNTLTGCYIACDPMGATAVSNRIASVYISASAHNNTIGGRTAASRNVISGSAVQGVVIEDAGTTGNIVEGNYIGLNAAGTGALHNGFAGVNIFGGAQSNMIGGFAAGAGNVISGNIDQGVLIQDAGSSSNQVVGNFIGLNAAGTSAVGNGFAGVQVYNGPKNTLIQNNVISGNANQGILIWMPGSDQTTVAGNYIGLNAAGTAAIANASSGVQITTGPLSTLVTGNVVSGNNANGVEVDAAGTASTQVTGNIIGLNAAGTAAVPNGYAGVSINSAIGTVVGGITNGARNVISGNNAQGVAIAGTGAVNNQIVGNYIGLNATGSAAAANAGAGVLIFYGAQSNLIGGTLAAARNVISGNGSQGVLLYSNNVAYNTVEGNYIGLDATGITAVANGNGYPGIEVTTGPFANTIGGGTGARNYISGNTAYGIALDTGVAFNTVYGNTIGLNVAGAVVSNSFSGIAVFGGAVSNIIGGIGIGQGNVVAGQPSYGIQISDSTSVNNAVRGNSIYGNAGAAVDVINSANGSEAAPGLTSAVLTTNLTVAGTVKDPNSATVDVDFYANPPGTTAEARVYIGTQEVVTSASGSANLSFSAAAVPVSSVITANATSGGNTSSTSAGRTVTATSTPNDGIPDAWRMAHFGTTSTNATNCAACDADGDHVSNYQEFLAGTDPNNPASKLPVLKLTPSGADIQAGFTSVAGVVYRVESRSSLTSGNWLTLMDQFVTNGGTVTLTDPGANGLTEKFYRLSVTP